MGPNRELNPQPSGARDSAATNGATRPGRNESIMNFSQMRLLCCPAPPARPQASLFSVWRKLPEQLSEETLVCPQPPGLHGVARTTRCLGPVAAQGLWGEAGRWPDSRSNEPSEKSPWTGRPWAPPQQRSGYCGQPRRRGLQCDNSLRLFLNEPQSLQTPRGARATGSLSQVGNEAQRS